MIPKIIHQIWIGKKPITEELQNFSRMWKDMYSDFSYCFWTDKNVDECELFDERRLDLYKNPSHWMALKTDLLRYALLERYGGIYIDMDCEPLRRFDDSLFEYDFFSGKQLENSIAIGLMGCCKDNLLFKKLNGNIVKNVNDMLKIGYGKDEVQRLTGPDFFTSICEEFFENPKYKFFEPKYLYPYTWNEMERRNEDFRKTSPESYSVHHWCKNWN